MLSQHRPQHSEWSGRPSTSWLEDVNVVLNMFQRSPQKSLRQAARESGITYYSLCNVFKTALSLLEAPLHSTAVSGGQIAVWNFLSLCCHGRRTTQTSRRTFCGQMRLFSTLAALLIAAIVITGLVIIPVWQLSECTPDPKLLCGVEWLPHNLFFPTSCETRWMASVTWTC